MSLVPRLKSMLNLLKKKKLSFLTAKLVKTNFTDLKVIGMPDKMFPKFARFILGIHLLTSP